MRVIQFIDTLHSGGKERQLVELLKGLVSVPGVESELLVMSGNFHFSEIEELDIPVHLLQRKTTYDPGIFLRLYRLLKERKPDILHSWSSMCSFYALPIVKILSVPFANGCIRSAPPALSPKQKTWWINKFTFLFSDAIVANSKAGLDAYRVPEKKAYYIYNGFDFARLDNLPSPERVKKKYQVTTKFVVGMVATFSANKDYTTFINAAIYILQKRDDVTFLAVGDGKNRQSCRALVPKALEKKILFPGKLKEVEALGQIMNIGVLLSNDVVHGEGISNSIMEYMALGKPVIATNCGGNCELVQEGTTGLLISAGDSLGLASKIDELLDNEQLVSKLGTAGRERLENQFSLDLLTQRHIALYRKLCKLKKHYNGTGGRIG